MAKSKNTTKKLKRVVGCETLVRPKTGEIITATETIEEDTDFNFDKIWIANAQDAIDAVGNKKTKILFWLIENKKRDNTLPYTYPQIAKQTGISERTVAETMSKLLKANFIRRNKDQAGYMINPDTLFMGKPGARQYILNVYQELGYEEPELTDREKADNIIRAINELRKELEKLNIDENKKVIDFPSDNVSEDRLSN